MAPKGRSGDDVRLLLARAGRLLLGYVTRKHAGCELRHHDGQPPDAVTVAEGGALMCEAHRVGERRP